MKYIFAILFAFSGIHAQAQRLWGDIYLGATNYKGELQNHLVTLQQAHFAGGVGATYNLSKHLSFRGRVLIGKLSGDDKYSYDKDRNLNFTSGLTEFQAGLEYYLFSLPQMPFTPYLFAGVAVFHFDPFTHDSTGVKYFLQPLSTEGQGMPSAKQPYSLTQLSIPFGGGLKLALSDNLNIGAELGFRKTFTDYIDDVGGNYADYTKLKNWKGPKAVELAFRSGEIDHSRTYPAAGTERGFAKDKDLYFFAGLTLSVRLSSADNFFRNSPAARRAEKFTCPSLF